eukprot:351955-Chlamydomonas_euryale.AAC.20
MTRSWQPWPQFRAPACTRALAASWPGGVSRGGGRGVRRRVGWRVGEQQSRCMPWGVGVQGGASNTVCGQATPSDGAVAHAGAACGMLLYAHVPRRCSAPKCTDV